MNLRIGCVLALLLVYFAVANADAITLAQDGVPKAVIVVAKETIGASTEPDMTNIWYPQPAKNKISAGAKDLQTYIEKISGAKIPVVSDDSVPAGSIVILIGRSALTKPYDAKIPSGLTPRRHEEGFVIICKDNILLLAGNDEGPYHGTEYAVAEFLEQLGVRWFMPSDYGEVVPKQATIQVADMEITQIPDFALRNWWGPKSTELYLTEYRWKVRNKMNPVLHFLTIPADSSSRYLISDAQAKEDSGLLSLTQEGVPYIGVPNLSNPKTVKVCAETIKERFRKNPNETSYGFAPDDGLPRDWRPESLKMNLGFPDVVGRVGVASELSVSEEWFAFVNAIARDVRTEFPDHLIGTNGYANRNTPPQGMELDPNVYVMFAAIWSDTLHSYDNAKSWMTIRQGQMLKRWTEMCKNVYIYNYLYIMLASGGTPVPLTKKIVRDFPLMKKWGMIGFSDEGRSVLAESGIQCMYLRAKLEWDADLNTEEVLNDYYAKWYGPADKPAKAFWNALELLMENTPMLGHEDRILPYVYSKDLIAELDKHADEAKKLATAEPFKTRVRADELILNHLKGYMAMTKAEWDADFTSAVKQGKYMLDMRRELSKISISYFQDPDSGVATGFYYWDIPARVKYYQKIADLTTGKTGDMVLVLPEKAQFKLDPKDEGRFYEWYSGNWDDKDWNSLLTTTPFYIQEKGTLTEDGYPYMGVMWYRLTVDVPASAKGKKIMLYAPTVETEAWIWVNGKFAGYRPYIESYVRPNEINMDVTNALEPGRKNVIAIRVNTGLGAAGMAGGFYSRLFLYAPK